MSDAEFLRHVYKFSGAPPMKWVLAVVSNGSWWMEYGGTAVWRPCLGDTASIWLSLSRKAHPENPAMLSGMQQPRPHRVRPRTGVPAGPAPATVPAKSLLQLTDVSMNKMILVPRFKSSQLMASGKEMSWPHWGWCNWRCVNKINAVLSQ